MTAVLSFDRSDDLCDRTRSSTSLLSHMQPSPHALEKRAKEASLSSSSFQQSGSASSSVSTSSDASFQRHRQNIYPHSSAASADEPGASTAVDPVKQGQPDPSRMRDRFDFREEEGSHPSPAHSGSRDWQYAPSHSSSSSGAVKRRHPSRRSPSRPRSQQGSQASQIASVKEVERENERAGHFASRKDESADDDMQDEQSPRKSMRLDKDASATTSSADWLQKKKLSTVSESEPTSASSTTRMHFSRSRNGTPDGETQAPSASHKSMAYSRSGQAATGAEGAKRTFDESDEANYTWRHRDRAGEQPERRGDMGVAGVSSPTPDHSRAPHSTGSGGGGGTFRASAPSSTPSSSMQPQRQFDREGRSIERSASPPPRLPGFATFHPYESQQSHSASQSERRHSNTSSPPRQVHHQLAQQGSQHLLPVHHNAPGHQRINSYGVPAYAAASPHAGQGPSSLSAHSPALSQASHTHGQAFIHPSLAGLPGSGGGTGSKQQPSFVSKLYSMLEDDSIEDMIAWGPAGTTFSVANPAEFAKVVLPNWFKHSNWQSFVRQLNMYGFHKVNHTYQGTPEEEIQVWEFKHPSFRRGEVHLLSEIKRKSSRHKRQDSLTRSMTHAPEYDMMGTPSPEMEMAHMGNRYGAMHAQVHPHSGGHPPAHPSFGAPVHRAPAASVHPYADRPMPPAGAPVYREYAERQGLPPSASAPVLQMQAEQQRPQHVQHARRPSGGATSISGPMPPSSGMHGAEQDIRHSEAMQQLKRDPMHVEEPVAVRVDDLSDRVDAIIRHASYLEGQLRTVSEQLVYSQQSEASLRTHVHHLEAQMRSLSDQVYQYRQGSGSGGASGGGMGPAPSPSSLGVGAAQHPHPPASPSSSIARLRSQQGGVVTSGNNAGAGRYTSPASAAQHAPSMSASSPYPGRSPVMAHPSYAMRSAPPAQSGPMDAPGSHRGAPASSADAYTSLGPPPPPGRAHPSSGGPPGMIKDELP